MKKAITNFLSIIFLLFLAIFFIGCDFPDVSDIHQVDINQALNESYIEYAPGDNENSVTADIKFVNCKDYRYDYTWESSNEDVIDNLGNVTIQDIDTVVIISLTVKNQEKIVDKTFTLTVKGNNQDDYEYTYDLENVKSELSLNELRNVSEDGEYTNHLDVIAYIHKYHKLPSNYLTKSQAKAIGWTKGIGGDTFNNREQELPITAKNTYVEVDVNFYGSNRGSHRLVYNRYTFDIYYTDDHYQSFTYMIGEKK